ncbi:LysR family transcriptional regulator [Enterobacter cloacae subsp. cloacae]|nr:LysR family transcriptional regulator [Enterobacter cloacae subsp. cloacae]
MSRKFDYLGDVEVFITVVEHGSFTAAAVVLSTTPLCPESRVSAPEAFPGFAVITANDPPRGLTEAGRVYLEQARSAFALRLRRRTRGGAEGDLTGRANERVPTTYGHYRLPPLLARFAQHYPRVQVG